jgi:hypothetical protein
MQIALILGVSESGGGALLVDRAGPGVGSILRLLETDRPMDAGTVSRSLP